MNWLHASWDSGKSIKYSPTPQMGTFKIENRKRIPRSLRGEEMYLLACGQEAPWCSTNLVLWPVPLNIPLLSPPDMLIHSQGLSSLQSLLRAAPQLLVLCSWHLHVPYNKVSPPETLFSSRCEIFRTGACPLIVTSSGPGCRSLAEWKREQGSSTDSQVAFGPKLLCSPALPCHRPQAYIMRPGMNYSHGQRTNKGGSAGWAS